MGVRLDSLIISEVPEIFDDFANKNWQLLWRGSRDGFGARDFHSRCDGHANTLTLIEDIYGCVFGGLTPVKWESRVYEGSGNNCYKSDDSLKSFLFTLKNPHNIPARKFALNPEMKHRAIGCDSTWGPWFGGLRVCDNCNTNPKSFTNLGETYTNDTGVGGRTVFTGSQFFKVKEIEVFEITD
jgi:hypothetical protein